MYAAWWDLGDMLTMRLQDGDGKLVRYNSNARKEAHPETKNN